MNPITSLDPQNKYHVNTNVYEGPLDLLLELIERAELDITRLALAQVTDQYLNYLNHLQHRDPEQVSAFLVVATKLVQIKSNVLLPKPEPVEHSGEEEEDPGEALARQLITYKRFKEIAIWLGEREQSGLRSYLRIADVPFKVEPKIDLSNVTLIDLILAAKEVFLIKNHQANINTVVTIPKISIRDRINTILETLEKNRHISFRNITDRKNRTEIVVTFLALLELIKRHIVDVQQGNLFGEIELESAGEWDKEQEIDLEFDE